jgi:hypothetical protein
MVIGNKENEENLFGENNPGVRENCKEKEM